MRCAAFFLAACEGAGVAPGADPRAQPIDHLSIERVDDVAEADPTAPYWARAEPGLLTLVAQPMIAPRPQFVTTEKVQMQAVHDGADLAIRLVWADEEPSEAGRVGETSDAIALQFPMAVGPLPPVFMGARGQPVHIFHWRAQYQRDAERGKPEMHELYPNASVDMYAMDFHDAPDGSRDEREMFNPAVALGNPQSSRKSGVDEIVAEGFSTSSVQATHDSDGRGVWSEGTWTVVIRRPLAIEGGSTLEPGGSGALTVAVWQGGKGEVGSRKSLFFSWLPVEVAP